MVKTWLHAPEAGVTTAIVGEIVIAELKYILSPGCSLRTFCGLVTVNCTLALALPETVNVAVTGEWVGSKFRPEIVVDEVEPRAAPIDPPTVVVSADTTPAKQNMAKIAIMAKVFIYFTSCLSILSSNSGLPYNDN